MKKYALRLLILLCLPTIAHAQADYSKEELHEAWKKVVNQPVAPSDYRLYVDSVTLHFTDSLKAAGVDTIGIYEKRYDGLYALDSCRCGHNPRVAVVQWVDNGHTFHRQLTKCCLFKTKEIDYSALIQYYTANFKQLNRAKIMPNIISISRDEDGELSFIFSMVDHTTRYLIYCEVGDHSKFVQLEEFDFENENSIFHSENNSSIIKSWRDIIESQLEEIER